MCRYDVDACHGGKYNVSPPTTVLEIHVRIDV